jgi:hypothetical protein
VVEARLDLGVGDDALGLNVDSFSFFFFFSFIDNCSFLHRQLGSSGRHQGGAFTSLHSVRTLLPERRVEIRDRNVPERHARARLLGRKEDGCLG